MLKEPGTNAKVRRSAKAPNARTEAESLKNQGNQLMQRGQLAEAEVLYRRAIAVDPKYINAYNNLGVSLMSQGKLEEAEKAYREAITRDPKFPGSHYNLGRMLTETKRPQQGEPLLRRAVKLHGTSPEWHLAWAHALAAVGKEGEAMSVLTEAVRMSLVEAPYDYAEDRSFKALRTLVKRGGDKAHAMLLAGLTMMSRGDNRRAAREFLKAVKQAPGWPEAHFWLAKAQMRIDDWNTGRLCYAAAIYLARKERRKGVAFVAEAKKFLGKDAAYFEKRACEAYGWN